MGEIFKEGSGMDLNHVTLTGILERDPITRLADQGTQQVSFTLRLTEAGPAGQEFTLYVPVEAYSASAKQAGELTAGAAILVADKLKWTSYTDKTGQKRTSLAVLVRLVKCLAPAPVAAGVCPGRPPPRRRSPLQPSTSPARPAVRGAPITRQELWHAMTETCGDGCPQPWRP